MAFGLGLKVWAFGFEICGPGCRSLKNSSLKASYKLRKVNPYELEALHPAPRDGRCLWIRKPIVLSPKLEPGFNG